MLLLTFSFHLVRVQMDMHGIVNDGGDNCLMWKCTSKVDISCPVSHCRPSLITVFSSVSETAIVHPR